MYFPYFPYSINKKKMKQTDVERLRFLRHVKGEKEKVILFLENKKFLICLTKTTILSFIFSIIGKCFLREGFANLKLSVWGFSICGPLMRERDD